MKQKAKNWIYSLFILGIFITITSSCKKDTNSDNPIQQNETVIQALSKAGITTYDGNRTTYTYRFIYNNRNANL